ncbi:hypothetical protein [Paenibacillus jiagnxiensis]|uniref:hypothetical protein n=1 Tax=Paenibacillus jiagnxiensis TaxID=3228926 RepID=UPI0033A03882
MKSNNKEEQEQGDLLVFKEQFFDIFLYDLPEKSSVKCDELRDNSSAEVEEKKNV